MFCCSRTVAKLTRTRTASHSITPGLGEYAWLDAVIALVSANGNTISLGTDLTSDYAKLWQELTIQLEAQQVQNGESPQ